MKSMWHMRLVTWPIMAMIALFLIWASRTEIDETVRGTGKVIPSSQTKILQHLEGGIVEEIFVQEGAHVKKGEPIYKLKNVFSATDSKLKKIDLHAAMLEKRRLEAQIAFAKDLNLSGERKEDPVVQDQIRIFTNEMKHYLERKSILENQLLQSSIERKKALAKAANLKKELKIAQENLSIIQKLRRQGAASKQQYLAELAKKQNILTQLSDIRSAISIAKQKTLEARTKIYTYKSEIKTKWLKELHDVTIKIEKLQQKNVADTDREKRKIVVSPVNGVVKKLYFHTIGGIIKPGDRIAEITPIDDSLVIEARIKTNDRGEVHTDQNVSIEITAYNYSRYGMLKGKVLSISPDSFTASNGSNYYQVKVKANHYAFAPDKPIVPGMIAHINILTGKRTIMDYLLKPIVNVTKHALREN